MSDTEQNQVETTVQEEETTNKKADTTDQPNIVNDSEELSIPLTPTPKEVEG